MRFKWTTIAVTLAAFVISIFGMRFVEQQFFPTSDRPEVLVDVGLRQNASIAATRELMDKLESQLKDDPDVLFWTSYVGRGAPRFVLAMDLPTPARIWARSSSRPRSGGPRPREGQAARDRRERPVQRRNLCQHGDRAHAVGKAGAVPRLGS